MKITFGSSKSSININGKSIYGKSIELKNGDVTIDGKDAGSIEGLGSDNSVYNIEVNGDVESLDLTNGTVEAKEITKVSTINADVNCDIIHGNVTNVSGDVIAKKIFGKTSTVSGDIQG